MSLSLSGAALFMLFVFVIAALGYLLGAISVKGVALGTAGVFVVALLFGAFFPDKMDTSWLKVVENMGLILFVTAVGFIAGPTFFGNLKRNFKSYVLLGIVIIASGALAAYICLLIGIRIWRFHPCKPEEYFHLTQSGNSNYSAKIPFKRIR